MKKKLKENENSRENVRNEMESKKSNDCNVVTFGIQC